MKKHKEDSLKHLLCKKREVGSRELNSLVGESIPPSLVGTRRTQQGGKLSKRPESILSYKRYLNIHDMIPKNLEQISPVKVSMAVGI